MIVVAVVEAVALVATVIAFTGVIRSLTRSHARRENLLVDQLLHAVGKPWTPPPAVEAHRAERRELDDERTLRFTPSPEQLPLN